MRAIKKYDTSGTMAGKAASIVAGKKEEEVVEKNTPSVEHTAEQKEATTEETKAKHKKWDVKKAALRAALEAKGRMDWLDYKEFGEFTETLTVPDWVVKKYKNHMDKHGVPTEWKLAQGAIIKDGEVGANPKMYGSRGSFGKNHDHYAEKYGYVTGWEPKDYFATEEGQQSLWYKGTHSPSTHKKGDMTDADKQYFLDTYGEFVDFSNKGWMTDPYGQGSMAKELFNLYPEFSDQGSWGESTSWWNPDTKKTQHGYQFTPSVTPEPKVETTGVSGLTQSQS